MILVFLFVVAIGLLASLQLAIRAIVQQQPALLWLASFVLCMLVPIWNMATYHAQYAGLGISSLPSLFSLTPWLYGPLLWNYVRQSTAPEKPWWPLLLNFLPFLVLTVLFFTSNALTASITGSDGHFVILVCHISGYIAAVVGLLWKCRRQFFDERSTPIPAAFIGFTILLLGLIIIMAFDFTVSAVAHFIGTVNITWWNRLFLVEGIYISLLALVAPILPWRLNLRMAKQAEDKGRISDSAAQAIASELVSRMEQNVLYTLPDLTLTQLAEHMGMTPHDISAVLNESLKVSFYDFVNRYRVEHACAALREDQSTSAIEIGFASGFNSKTAFYNAFRKFQNSTPAKYRQQQWVQSSP